LVGDAESPGQADASFDLVVSSFVLQFLHRPDRMAHHAARLLRPGGRMVLCSTRRHDLLWDFVQDLVDVYIVRATRPLRKPPPPLDAADLLAGAGMRIAEVRDVSHRFVLPDPEAWWAFAMSQGQRVLLDALSTTDRNRFHDRVMERLADHVTPAGLPITATATIVDARSG